MQKIIIGLAFLFIFGQAQYAAGYELKGRVTDISTGRVLIGANIMIEDLHIGLPSGKDGEFIFPNVAGGPHLLSVSFVGYEVIKKTVWLSSDSQSLEFALKPIILPGEKIIVTASRARNRISPGVFSNISREELSKRYTTQDVPVLLSELPSASYYSDNGNGIGYSYMSLRGFEQRRISVMINGIPQNDPEDHNVYWIDFPDLSENLQDIQVQRGAGSSFYGPPSIGGSVNMVTSVFEGDAGAGANIGYGSYNTQKYSFKINSGLINNSYSLYGRFSRILSDGYRNDSWVDYFSYFFGAVKYTEHTTTKIHLYGGPIKDHLSYYGVPKNFLDDKELRKTNFLSSNPEVKEQIENFFQPHYEIINVWKLSDRTSFTNALFFIQGDGFFDFDGSWADTTYFRITNKYGFNPTSNPGKSMVRAFVGNKQGGWLPRVTLKHGSGVLNLGAEMRYHRSLHWGSVKWAQYLPPGVSSDRRYYEYKGSKIMTSGYVDEAYSVNSRARIKASLQIVYNRYGLFDEKFAGNDFTVPYLFFNPRVGMNVSISDEFHTFFSYARTRREPRLKTLYDAAESSGGALPQFEELSSGVFDFNNPLVESEVLNDYELGVGFKKNIISGSINLFWMDFRNEIIKKGGLDRFGDPITGNADKTTHKGFEAVLAADPYKGLKIGGNFSISRNTLDRYTFFDRAGNFMLNPQGPDSVIAYNLDGNRIAGFADIIWNARASYEFQLTRHIKPDLSMWVHHEGAKYTDNFEGKWYGSAVLKPETVVDSYTILNASISLRLGDIAGFSNTALIVQGFNLTNEYYAAYGEGESFFPAALRNYYIGLEFGI